MLSKISSNILQTEKRAIGDYTYDADDRIAINSSSLLKKGFWSNQLILNLNQAKRFYEQKADSTNELESIKLIEKDYFPGGFKPDIRVTHRFYRIE